MRIEFSLGAYNGHGLEVSHMLLVCQKQMLRQGFFCWCYTKEIIPGEVTKGNELGSEKHMTDKKKKVTKAATVDSVPEEYLQPPTAQLRSFRIVVT